MPEISRFLGIVIRMYYRDHLPPHFHAEYAEHEIEVEIETGVVDGRFPRRALGAVLDGMNFIATNFAPTGSWPARNGRSTPSSRLSRDMILHVTRAEYITDHRVHLWFNDGSDGMVDLGEVLQGAIFEPLRDPAYFKRFNLAGHTLSWDNGADFAPAYLHELAHAHTAA